MNEHASKDELQALAKRMRQVADQTYALFFAHGMGSEVHAFLEFNGLIQKYVDICTRAADAGIDFRMTNTHNGTPLPVEAHDIEYMAEKLDCIFGPALADKKLRDVFTTALFGPDIEPATPKEEPEQKKLGEGWGWPMLSRKCHYFRDGRALCGKWLYTGEYTPDTKNATPDDCATCLKKRQSEKQKVTT